MFMRLLISHRVLIGERRYNKNWSFKGVLIRYGVLANLFTELNGSNVYFRNLLLCCLSWIMMMLVKKQKLRVRVIHGFYNSFILECHRYHTPHLEITLFKMRVCAGVWFCSGEGLSSWLLLVPWQTFLLIKHSSRFQRLLPRNKFERRFVSTWLVLNSDWIPLSLCYKTHRLKADKFVNRNLISAISSP